MGERRDFDFGTQLDHSQSQPTNDKTSLKEVWLWSRDPFKFLVPPKMSQEMLKLATSNFVHWLTM